ncbi:MAG: hypothetical protein FH762_12870 [Firmicutes bacterium]|nr:hypothetical protein [Bacillota bacterium]
MKKIILILMFILIFSSSVVYAGTPINITHTIDLGDGNMGNVFLYYIRDEFTKSNMFTIDKNSPFIMHVNTIQNCYNELSYSVIWVMKTKKGDIFLDSSLGRTGEGYYELHAQNVIATASEIINNYQ